MTDLAAELARCDAEIERAARGECIGAAIGFLDWHAERIEIEEEMRMSELNALKTRVNKLEIALLWLRVVGNIVAAVLLLWAGWILVSACN